MPVDYVINTILLAVWETATKPVSPVEIYAAASSDLNPLMLSQCLEFGYASFNQIELDRRIQRLWAFKMGDEKMYSLLSFIIEKFPVYLLKLAAIITNDEKMNKNSELGIEVYA